MRLFKRKRFFIVFYTGVMSSGVQYGGVDVTTDGGYVQKQLLQTQIKELKPKICGDLMISGIIELSKSDFQYWTIEEKK